MIVLPAPGSSASRNRRRGWGSISVDCLNLVRQGADAGQADGEMLVVGVGEANPMSLHRVEEIPDPGTSAARLNDLLNRRRRGGLPR